MIDSAASDVPTANGSLAVGDDLDAGSEIHNEYKRGLEKFRSLFNNSMRNKPVKHDHVHVLMWTWGEELDDLKVKEEVDRLEHVFEKTYGFLVQREKLEKLQKANHQLNSYLSTFMHNYDNENTLLIFYYAGHGMINENSLSLVGTTAQQTDVEQKRNNIAWTGAEKNIRATQADVLVIFDCCYAGGFGGYEFRAAGDAAFQCLAACERDQRTRKPGKDSFTSALIWALEELRPCHQFTAKTLLDKVKQYDKLPKDQSPKLLRRDENNDELVWIATQIMKENETDPGGERRNVKDEYVDLRFKFWRRIEDSDAEVFAKHMSRLVNDEPGFQAKQVVVLDKTSPHYQAMRTVSSAVQYLRKKSISGHSRNRSPIVLASTSAVPAALGPDTTFLPISKRLPSSGPELRERGDIYIEPESVVFHLRMALHYLLQNIISRIVQIAERILPAQKPENHLSDMD